jgi:hypothetical protein
MHNALISIGIDYYDIISVNYERTSSSDVFDEYTFDYKIKAKEIVLYAHGGGIVSHHVFSSNDNGVSASLAWIARSEDYKMVWSCTKESKLYDWKTGELISQEMKRISLCLAGIIRLFFIVLRMQYCFLPSDNSARCGIEFERSACCPVAGGHRARFPIRRRLIKELDRLIKRAAIRRIEQFQDSRPLSRRKVIPGHLHLAYILTDYRADDNALDITGGVNNIGGGADICRRVGRATPRLQRVL